ncbi:MAG: hypothetical protein ACJATI_002886 [Halioglobus sp.]|jgi:hypothetical protein
MQKHLFMTPTQASENLSIKTALQNSEVCHKVKQVGGPILIDFIETGNIFNDRKTLIESAELQVLREQIAADVVILLAGDVYENYGVSTLSNFGDPNFSHAIVEINAPSNRYTVAHEWAHDFNAIHDDGIEIDGESINTIMAPMLLNESRILHYSNPDVYYDGLVTGIEGTNDNASTIDNWGCYVANYANSGNPCESVYSDVTSETLFINGQFVNRYCLEVSNCFNKPDRIVWEYSSNGINWTIMDDNTDCFDLPIGIVLQPTFVRVNYECGECEIRPEVFVFNKACENSETRNDKKNIELEIFPNPVANILQLKYSEDFSIDSIIQIFDLKGQLVNKEKLNATINIEGLDSGTYILRISNENKKAYAKFVKI